MNIITIFEYAISLTSEIGVERFLSVISYFPRIENTVFIDFLDP